MPEGLPEGVEAAYDRLLTIAHEGDRLTEIAHVLDSELIPAIIDQAKREERERLTGSEFGNALATAIYERGERVGWTDVSLVTTADCRRAMRDAYAALDHTEPQDEEER